MSVAWPLAPEGLRQVLDRYLQRILDVTVLANHHARVSDRVLMSAGGRGKEQRPEDSEDETRIKAPW